MRLTSRSILLIAAVVFILFMNMPPALAQNYVYTAGDKIRRWDLQNLANPPLVVCNAAGADVAVDPVHGKIFWGGQSGHDRKDHDGKPQRLRVTHRALDDHADRPTPDRCWQPNDLLG